MKKILKLLIVFMTVLASISLSNICAANENLVIEKNTLKDGHIELIVNVKKDSHICGGEMIFEYNKDKLELESVKMNKEQNMLVTVNKDYKNEGNKIKAVFASANEIDGRILAITLKTNEKKISKSDIILTKCSIGNGNGKIESSINEATVQFENKKGNSLIDQSFQDIDQSEKVQESTASNETKKNSANKNENTQTKKQKTKNKKRNNKVDNACYFIGIIVILSIGYIIYKFKKK
ncbi:hypothetical protein [Faecalibacillus intestinalis]|jgi:hypothetical protein|uniref:hypothetical protein n=1 Tax=Faecalibacillus intestinalis TaxID=1982626 RepID=UPI0035222D37